MNKLILTVFAVSIFFAACGRPKDTAADCDAFTDVPAPSAPASAVPATEAPKTTEAVVPTPTPAPTDEPSEPLPFYDPDLYKLVNLGHHCFTEDPGELLCDHLTAVNVTCDPRRHANGAAADALNEMLLAAEGEGEFHFVIASAFRYNWEQKLLWDNALAEDPDYGNDPYNKPLGTLPPYCSEHVTGLAFDILCESCPHSDPSYVHTPEALWLSENAHRFGFILRYPEEKQHITGVKFEPWHYRYVGREAADYIFRRGLCLEEFAALYGD